MIATDHAPHDPPPSGWKLAGLFSPDRDGGCPRAGEAFTQAANGVIGLETALGLALELVHRGVLVPSRLVEMMSLNPARLLRLEGGTLVVGARADITLIDPKLEWKVDPAKFMSSSRNTPFTGRRLKGRAVLTIVAGDVVSTAERGRERERAARTAILALADGRIFHGLAFGAIGETVGEVVFNTAMTGYQEVLTDPSYKGQIVCMTYPEIGNVGINDEDTESGGVHVEGFIVKDYRPRPSNWRSQMPLGEYLEQAGVVGIEGIDTRALVRHIRTCGAQEAVISSVNLDPEAWCAGQGLARAGRARPGQGSDLPGGL